MTFTCNRKQLANELGLLSTIAERKTTMPVLATVLFQFNSESLKLTATDIDMSLVTEVLAAGEAWSGCVPLKQLHELTRLFSGDEIQFIPEDGRIVIKWSKSRHKLPAYEADKFPAIDRPQVELVTMDGPMLSKALSRALRCVTPDAKDFWMQGVSLRSIEGQVYIVASNSRQTAISAIGSPLKVDVLIPQRAIAALVKLLDSTEVSIGVSDNHVLFQQASRKFTTRLLDAKFPEWRPLVPTSFKYSITLDSETARQAFRLAAVTAYETALIPIPLRLTMSGDEMVVETRESERGHSSETLAAPCVALNGNQMSVSINGAHFIDFFDDAKKTVLSFNDNPGPLQLSPEDEPNYRYITMALKA